ncbi:momilactone A synthase-like [Phalaenopsis equestris]|uniref:momilactone A synthase-like n=1 Tax=Phalaenopsis equestris TaxID=78828 RepID=UPI0009E3EEB7|nr:momilactone A synthase-like [Phalaenopsis equestris]
MTAVFLQFKKEDETTDAILHVTTCAVPLRLPGCGGAPPARLFCRQGAKVVVADIHDERGSSVCTELGQTASYVRCDVTDEDDIRRAVDHAVDNFGQLDIMFNNAGITGAGKARITDNTKEDFLHVLSINLLGVFLGTKHAARVMVPAGSGSILSMASTAAVTAGLASHAYTSSKHGVVGLTRNAAAELGRRGVRVNCLSAATVATAMATGFMGMGEEEVEAVMEEKGNLRGVVLKAEDVARAALFLCSDEGRFVSGHNLVLDGGLTAVNPNFDFFKV